MYSEKTNLFWCNWSLILLVEVFDSVMVTTKVLLASNKHYGHFWAEVHDLSYPLISNAVVSLGLCQWEGVIPFPERSRASRASRQQSR